jgi:hypothetical protein
MPRADEQLSACSASVSPLLFFKQASSVGCVVDTSFYNKFLSYSVVPLLVGGGVIVFYFIPRYIYVEYQKRSGATRLKSVK